jgi:hypothetical protein
MLELCEYLPDDIYFLCGFGRLKWAVRFWYYFVLLRLFISDSPDAKESKGLLELECEDESEAIFEKEKKEKSEFSFRRRK